MGIFSSPQKEANGHHTLKKKSDKNSRNSGSTDEKRRNAAIKKRKENKKMKANYKKWAESMKVPKTVQDTIPYKYIYKGGIMELETGVFSKSYILADTNFRILSQKGQENVFHKYAALLNSFGEHVKMEVTIYNRTRDMELFQNEVMVEMQNDDLNEFREEYNQMLIRKMAAANNNIEKVKILTLTIEADSIQEAVSAFVRLDSDTIKMLVELTGEKVRAMTAMERICMLYDIYNPRSGQKLQKLLSTAEEYKDQSISTIHEMGITTKDVVGPDSFEFKGDMAVLGTGTYVRTYYAASYPAWLKGDAFTELADLPANLLASVHYTTLPHEVAEKKLKTYRVNVNSDMAVAEKDATRQGYGTHLVSQELQEHEAEAKALTNDFTRRNQNIVLVTFVVAVFASSLEELDKLDEQLKRKASKVQIQIRVLNWQQEYGLTTALPVGIKKVAVQRIMTTESSAMLIPFSVKELFQEDGIYYGLNAESDGMILYNRTLGQNYNGMILGMPGSGKSFKVKEIITNIMLNTNDDIYVIDPEREYLKIAQAYHGESVFIENGSKVYLNPFDLDMDDFDGNDPVKNKADYIATIIDIAIGGRFGLSNPERSLIDRVVNEIYEPYIKHLDRTRKSIDLKAVPTWVDFYNHMLAIPLAEAQNMALSMERYVKGSQDIFSHRTNVDTNNRFVVYDIKNIGSGLKELGLHICLNAIWNRMIENSKKGKKTWIFLDEFHLFLSTKTSAEYIQDLWKRGRKWYGIPTAITQNVEEILKSEYGRTILNCCGFVMMMNQSPMNLVQLSNIFNISQEEQKYINNAPSGQGLIWMTGGTGNENGGGTIIPFIDEFPADTKLYKLMSTKPSEMEMGKRIKI